jgi:2-methylcitrate dehydratase PrpD
MGYDERAMKEMVNLSSSLTLATSAQTMLQGATVRNVYSGVSGFMGILAHDLVQSGFTGESDGLGSVFGSVVSDSFSPEVMTKDLGSRYELMRNFFKKHACCRINHATLDALSALLAEAPKGRIQPENIAEVQVMSYSLATQLDDRNPKNMLAAKFSIPFSVATFIFHGHAGVSSFRPDAIANAAIRALARKVTVQENPSFTAMMPDQRPSRVRVTLFDGSTFETEVFGGRGEFDNPYDPEALREKYYELTDPVWGHEVATELYSAVMKLEKVDDVNHVTAAQTPVTKR